MSQMERLVAARRPRRGRGGPACGRSGRRPDGIDPDAEKVLRGMTSYLGNLPAFSVNADVDLEYIDTAGQKLQLTARGASARAARRATTRSAADRSGASSSSSTARRRRSPAGSAGPLPDRSARHDRGAIDALRPETGLDLSGADLLYADAYAGLVTDVTSGAHYGTAWVNGVECYHLAFRAAKVDWQIWVQTGDQPLPMKYIITTKWMTGAPEYTVRFGDWNTQPTIPAGRFALHSAGRSERLASLQVNEMGEVEITGAQQ